MATTSGPQSAVAAAGTVAAVAAVAAKAWAPVESKEVSHTFTTNEKPAQVAISFGLNRMTQLTQRQTTPNKATTGK